ncbi:MAG: ParB N-terminal domain-containing protein [Planctomycetes bacterium]|nr:ParB N-terminal domain-containing protein [Planctomycetota bacterium]
MTTKTPKPFPTLKDLSLDAIRLDGGTQPRVRIDPETVREYAERMCAGDQFPPVQVYYDGTDHWLSDGFHRVKAAVEAGQTTIPAEVWEGTRDDAFWMSLAANKDHGLRRSNDDKARAVKAALAAKPRLSDGAIAEHVGVSDRMVAKYRAELTPKVSESAGRTGRDGRTINTANIGRSAPRKPAPPEPPDPDDIPLGTCRRSPAAGRHRRPRRPPTRLGAPSRAR